MSTAQVTWDNPGSPVKWDDEHPVTEKDLPGSTPLLRAAASKMPSSMSTPTNFERERDPGNYKSAGSIISGDIGLPGSFSPYPGMDMEAKAAAADQSHANDMDRKAMGRSLGYRGIAPIGESVGVNATGMEHEADIGNARGVMAHTAVPAAMAVAPLAAEGAVRAIGSGIPKIGPSLKMAGKVDSDFVGLVSPRAAHAQRLAAKLGEAMTPAKPAAGNFPAPEGLVRGSDEIFPSRPEPITPEQAHADAIRRGEIGTIYEPGDILEKPVLGRRESLADRAGIQPGRPEPNIEITRPPEPTGLRSKIGRPSIGQQQGPKIASYKENLEDAGIKQSMEENLSREGMRLRREQIEASSVQAKPKWERMAEVKARQAAEQIMAEAEAAATKPKKFTETPGIKSSKIATPEDLTGVLKESIRQAKDKKK